MVARERVRVLAIPHTSLSFELRPPIDDLTAETLQVSQNPPHGRVAAVAMNLASVRSSAADDDILGRIASPLAEADSLQRRLLQRATTRRLKDASDPLRQRCEIAAYANRRHGPSAGRRPHSSGQRESGHGRMLDGSSREFKPTW